MPSQNIIRAFLFVVFFSAGAAALSAAILCDDLLSYYSNRKLLKATELSTERLKTLNADYDAVLEQLENDPNYAQRIAPATIGTEPAGVNTVYPKVKADQLAAAKKALTENSDSLSDEMIIPDWLARSSDPFRRILLFIAGAFLVIISLVCFGPAKRISPEQ